MDVYYPTVDEVVQRKKLKGALLWSYLIFLLLTIFGAIGFVSYYAPKVPGIALAALGVALLIVLSFPLILWYKPTMGLTILFGAAMFFEADPRVARAGMFSTLPFFLNLNNW